METRESGQEKGQMESTPANRSTTRRRDVCPEPRLEVLEPRVLLSADGLLPAAAAAPQALAVLYVQDVPFEEDFKGGLPDAQFGWEYYSSNQGRIRGIGEKMRMDDSGPGDPYSLNEAIAHVNLTGKAGIQLRFAHTSLADDNTPLPASFTGHYNGDGVALSVDGVHWVTITSLTDSFSFGPIFSLDGALEQAKIDAASTDISDVRIKFQQFDNYPAPDDGREFDTIRIRAGCTPKTPSVTQDFDSGLPLNTAGWEYYSSNQGRVQAVGGRLRMDDSGPGDPYSLNEAILHLNLTGKSGVQLTLDHASLADDNTALPASFTGHANGDGIALSVDGTHWITVAGLTDSFTNRVFNLDAALALAKTAAGSDDVSDVRIKLQQYDNYPAPDDGREFDNVQVTAGITPQAVPYAQDFAAGMPAAAQGWEYFSSHQGRIAIVDGRLRMDDYGPGDPYSLNEAILHVNLTDKSGVQLTLDHASLADDDTSLPSSFTGHTHGDGIAVSVDGVHWITVANLLTSFTGRTFSLDATLAQARTAAGSDDLSDVRIKLQQYDNYPAPDDGRQFDNIRITSTPQGVLVPQTVPYTQDFAAGMPTLAQGWECLSSLQGRIQVVNGRLRMDDSGSGTPTGYALNHAILHVNLTGATGVQLSLDQYVLCPPNTYNTRGAISLSTNGRDWVTVLDMPDTLTESFTGQVFYLDAILKEAKAEAGSDDVSDVRIRFEHLDYNDHGVQIAREFDNIRITSGPQGALTPQTIPYAQDFSAGRPVGTQGWEYYSANQGRIQIVGGRLRMDDSGPGDPYSHNEAVLHVDLTGKSGVRLSLDHYNLSDDNDPLPAGEFRFHTRGDGIALSTNGLHWLPVASLTDSFTGGVFDLDAVLAKAKAAAFSDDVSDVRIRLQQYDNYPATDDGREFDNIQITCGAAVQSAPYAQDFSAGLPTGDQGWTYYTTNDGRFQVVDGRLRMDNAMPDDFRKRATEAVLHVNLAGKSDVRLSLDHYNVSDTVNDVLPPSSFTGHTLLNLIALSVDGTHWVTVTALRDSFTGQTFALDALLDQAKLDAGSDDLSDVRILLTRFNITTGAGAVREFDNIRITTA